MGGRSRCDLPLRGRARHNALALRCNRSVFGHRHILWRNQRHKVVWTWPRVEGRYMGAAGFGNLDRRQIPSTCRSAGCFSGARRAGLSQPVVGKLAPRSCPRNPYVGAHSHLGRPIEFRDMWDPDCRSRHREEQHAEHQRSASTRRRPLRWCSRTCCFVIVIHLIRQTGSDRLVLTGGHCAQRSGQHAPARSGSTETIINARLAETRGSISGSPVPGEQASRSALLAYVRPFGGCKIRSGASPRFSADLRRPKFARLDRAPRYCMDTPGRYQQRTAQSSGHSWPS